MRITNLFEVSGIYGRGTDCNILVAEMSNRSFWYCVEGCSNVNNTFEEIEEGTNVEMLSDSDYFNNDKEIYTLEDLKNAINS